MKRIPTLFLAAGLLLGGCNVSTGGDDPDIVGICGDMLSGDADIEADLATYSSTVASYCECFEATLEPMPEEDRSAVLKVVQIVGDLRKENNASLDDVVGMIEDNGTQYGVSETEFEKTGDVVDGVRLDLKDNKGRCPAAAAE